MTLSLQFSLFDRFFLLIEPSVDFSVFGALVAGPDSGSIGPDTHPNCATKG